MGKPTGFKEYRRVGLKYLPVTERIKNYKEFDKHYTQDEAHEQGARCMDCGIPFCHGDTGCPVDNYIPEFNDFVFKGQWKEALLNLHSTNNFPEFTGRVCPAPCESACTLGINEEPVSIKSIERTIIETGFENGWVIPRPPREISGYAVAVIGAGPAGLAAAQQLARLGHKVTVFEKNEAPGGLLRYGIPDFKLEKSVIDRRVKQMEAEGVVFKNNTLAGKDITAKDLMARYDAIVLAMGSEKPRDLPIPGREGEGVHFALEFLTANNRAVAGHAPENQIMATGKHVIVIGGGDTGSDCVGTSVRHAAEKILQLEIFPKPPEERPASTPWPYWPNKLRTSTSHEEGAAILDRLWSINTKEFIRDENGKLTAIIVVDVKFAGGKLEEVPGTEREIKADLVLLAMGFVHPVREGLLEQLSSEGLTIDSRGNVAATFGTAVGSHQTSIPKVFAAGDVRRGQSLVVWAISEGRKAAAAVDRYLKSLDA